MSHELATAIELSVQGQQLVLRGDGTLYLPTYQTLLVADLHLGKDASFRAAGIPVPAGMSESTLEQLSIALRDSGAKQLYILGDLIHDQNSLSTSLIDTFNKWREGFPRLGLMLVRGNHDRHVSVFPESWQLDTCLNASLDPFELRHEVGRSTKATREQNTIEVGGHLHPVTLVGRGADQMRLPCFVVGDRQIVLPAFGPFKGGWLTTGRRQKVYPICDGRIFCASV